MRNNTASTLDADPPPPLPMDIANTHSIPKKQCPPTDQGYSSSVSLSTASTDALTLSTGRPHSQDRSSIDSHMDSRLLSFEHACDRLDHEVPVLAVAMEDQGVDVFASATRIAIHFFPEWQQDWKEGQLDVRACTEGITNKLVKIKNQRRRQTILIRCYGHGTSSIIDRTNELICMMILSHEGMASPLYGRFQNGFCYGFMEGEVLTPDRMASPEIAALIARRMAQWHRMDIPSKHEQKPQLWATMHRWLDQVPERYAHTAAQSTYERHAAILAKDQLVSELRWLEDQCAIAAPNTPVVFCHNDLLSANIIYQSSEERVQFIDYEYGGYSYRGFDIANHFNEYAGFACDYSLFPSMEAQQHFIKAYLLESLDREAMPKEVEEVVDEVSMFVLVSHFYWAIWALVQAAQSDIDFDYMAYAVQRLMEYRQRKHPLQQRM